VYVYLGAEHYQYAIRLPENNLVREHVRHLLTRPVEHLDRRSGPQSTYFHRAFKLERLGFLGWNITLGRKTLGGVARWSSKGKCQFRPTFIGYASKGTALCGGVDAGE
jgi:hypothetical protein